MEVRAVSNYQEFVKVREMRILLYCILIENMKYLLCLSSPPQRKQDFYWTYPKVLAISVHDASTSRATSEVIRIRVEILWWAKKFWIQRQLKNPYTIILVKMAKHLKKKKKPCTYLDTGYSSCSRLSGKFSLVACLSVPENINVKRQGQVWDEYWLPFNCKNIQFVRTSARAMSLWRHSGKLERRAQVLWNLQNICVRYNYQIALLYYFFASSFHCRTRIFIPCHQGNWFSSRLSTLVRRRNPEKANKTVLPLALVGSEMIMANSAISTVSYSIRTRKELLNRYT